MRYVLMTCVLLIAAAAAAIALCAEPSGSPKAAAPATAGAHANQPLDPLVVEFMKPVETADGDSELLKKMKERHNTAVRLLEIRVQDYRKGTSTLSPVFDAARQVA